MLSAPRTFIQNQRLVVELLLEQVAEGLADAVVAGMIILGLAAFFVVLDLLDGQAEAAFIGRHMDEQAICAALDACLDEDRS